LFFIFGDFLNLKYKRSTSTVQASYEVLNKKSCCLLCVPYPPTKNLRLAACALQHVPMAIGIEPGTYLNLSISFRRNSGYWM